MRQMIDDCINKIDDTCIWFIKDDWQRANQELSGLVAVLQGLLEVLLGDSKGCDAAQQILGILDVVNHAMERGDSIQIADLLGYDIKNILLSIKLQIGQEEGTDE